jgi:predicted DNA-binding protein
MTEGKKVMVVSVRLDEVTYKGLEALAKADRRKLATYLGLVLEDHLAANQKSETGEHKPKPRKQ